MQLAVPPLMVTLGEGEDRKKLAGELRVIVPEVRTAPPALGTNTKVAALPVLADWRSATVMLNELSVTRSPMWPLAILSV